MRIISGSHKSRRINPPKNLPVRPTTDQAKEGLFNILMNHFEMEEVSVLDMFAGTGNIAYEFASRGCKKVVAVEKNHQATRFIQNVSTDFGFHKISIIRMDAFKYLERCNDKFDLIFADPPYDTEGIEKIPELVFDRALLLEGGWLILEHSQHTVLSSHKSFFEKRRYGYVHFSIFKK